MTVYFIQAGENGPVKIGHASSMDRRFNSLQVGHYEILHLIRTIDGNESHERWLHHHFREHHIRGEWFGYSAEMATIQPPENLTTDYDPDTFRAEICEFLAAHKMAPSILGMKSVGYGEGVIMFLRGRRSFRIGTIRRIRTFMSNASSLSEAA